MLNRKVYLGHLDIGPTGKLDLRHPAGDASQEDVAIYLFAYGLMADQVYMQTSAPLKIQQLHMPFIRFLDAFKTNENSENDRPVFSFTKNFREATYSDYFKVRINELKQESENNGELISYRKNHAEKAAEILDEKLTGIKVPMRIGKKPVADIFRKKIIDYLNFIIFLQNEPQHVIDTAGRMINKVNQTQFLQTFKLIKSMEFLRGEEIILKEFYEFTRSCYRQANAEGLNAINCDDFPIWDHKNIGRFLRAIGLEILACDARILNPRLLFLIRKDSNFQELREHYLKCKSQESIDHLLTELTPSRQFNPTFVTFGRNILDTLTHGADILKSRNIKISHSGALKKYPNDNFEPVGEIINCSDLIAKLQGNFFKMAF